LSQQKARFDASHVELVAISVDSPEDSKEFEENKELTMPLLSDPEMKIISAYGVAMKGNDIAVPSVFVVDSSGTIRWFHVGETMMDRPAAEVLLEEAEKLGKQAD